MTDEPIPVASSAFEADVSVENIRNARQRRCRIGRVAVKRVIGRRERALAERLLESLERRTMLWWDVWEAATLSSEDTMSVLRQVRELEVTRGSAAENAS